MSSFHIIEHQIPCQHIREYARATSGSQETVLHLAVKQYVPKDNPNPRPGDVTIIGAHANGFPKGSTSLYGMKCTLGQSKMGSASGVFG